MSLDCTSCHPQCLPVCHGNINSRPSPPRQQFVRTHPYCAAQMFIKEQFNDMIFTDESSIQLETHRKKCCRCKKEPRKLKPRPKHPPKVHVLARISKRGATMMVIFTGTMTAIRYTLIKRPYCGSSDLWTVFQPITCSACQSAVATPSHVPDTR